LFVQADVMKVGKYTALVFLGFVLATETIHAGSVVVWDGGKNLGTAYGRPVAMARQRALEAARRKGWTNVRVIGASNVSGYGAIATARHPSGHGSLIGVALGRRSATEADALAIEQCVKAGGTDVKVTAGFRG
jgi:hypothetical protein